MKNIYVDRIVQLEKAAALRSQLASLGINCVREKKTGNSIALTFEVPSKIGFGALNQSNAPAKQTA